MSQVSQIRKKELHQLKNAAYLNASFAFSFTCAPFMVRIMYIRPQVTAEQNVRSVMYMLQIKFIFRRNILTLVYSLFSWSPGPNYSGIFDITHLYKFNVSFSSVSYRNRPKQNVRVTQSFFLCGYLV